MCSTDCYVMRPRWVSCATADLRFSLDGQGTQRKTAGLRSVADHASRPPWQLHVHGMETSLARTSWSRNESTCAATDRRRPSINLGDVVEAHAPPGAGRGRRRSSSGAGSPHSMPA